MKKLKPIIHSAVSGAGEVKRKSWKFNRTALSGLAVAACVSAAWPTQALAQGAPSQGCQASNFDIDATLEANGGGSWNLPTPIPLSSYAVGETITLTFRTDNVGEPENVSGAYLGKV